MIPSVQYPVLKVPACGARPRGFRSSAFVLGARLNNTRLPGPCPGLFCLRRYLHILHTYGVQEGFEADFGLPYIWMAHGALGRARCTAHPQAAPAGDGARGARPSPHPGGPYADALRHDAQSRCSPHGISTGGGAWTRKRWVDGSAGLCPTWRRRRANPTGQRAPPTSRISDMRSLRPRQGRKGTFGRAQQGFTDWSIEVCASPFRLYAQRREPNHQPPIPLGSLYSGKPPSSIPEPPLFLNMRNERQFKRSKGAVLI